MTNLLARQTISAIESALDEKRSAAISEIIQIVQELTSKASSISISELSELIGRDLAITEKIISASNTLAFKVGGHKIASINEAVHALGFQKIRTLAISILLVDSASQSLNPYEQREIASLSVCSGLMAQCLVQSENLSLDPELAFVCSSLRNYGKLLMTSFLIDKYRKAKSLASEVGDDRAFESIFGIQPLKLGKLLLQTSSLPRNITDTFRDVSREALARSADSAEKQLLVIAELCVRVSEVTFDKEVAPERFDDSVQGVLDRFENTLPIELDSINQALIEVDANLERFSQTIGTPASAAPAAKILKARVNGDPLPELPEETNRRDSQRNPKSISEMNDQEREAFAEANFQEAILRISEEKAGATMDTGKIHQIATQAILKALSLANCMIFIKEEHDENVFSARFGHGDLFRAIRNRPFISKLKRDIFGICINRKEDILIQDVNAGKIRSVIPDWIDTDERNESLVVLPILAEEQVFAIILGSRDQGAIKLGKCDLRRLKEIRRLLTDLELQARRANLCKTA